MLSITYLLKKRIVETFHEVSVRHVPSEVFGLLYLLLPLLFLHLTGIRHREALNRDVSNLTRYIN